MYVLHKRAKKGEMDYTRQSKRSLRLSVSFVFILQDSCLYLYRKIFKPQVKQRVYGQKELPKNTTDSGSLLPDANSATVAMDTSMLVLCMKIVLK